MALNVLHRGDLAAYGGGVAPNVVRELVREAVREAVRRTNPQDVVNAASHAGGRIASAVKQYFEPATTVSTTTRHPTAGPTSAPTPAPRAAKAPKASKTRSLGVARPVMVSPAVAERVTAVRNRAKKSKTVVTQPRARATYQQNAVPVRTTTATLTLPRESERAQVMKYELCVDAYIPRQQVTGVQLFTQWGSFSDPALGLAQGEGVRLQPGDGSLGPQAQTAFATMTEWRILRMWFRWVNTMANTSAGTVLVGVDPVGNVAPPANRAEYIASCICVDSNAANAWEIEIPLQAGMREWKLVRRTAFMDGPRTRYDAGTVNCATEFTDLAVNAPIGRLELKLELEGRCDTRIQRIAGLYAPVDVFVVSRPLFTDTTTDMTPFISRQGRDRTGITVGAAALQLPPGVFRLDYAFAASGTAASCTMKWGGTAFSNNVFDSAVNAGAASNVSGLGNFSGFAILSVLDGLGTLTLTWNANTNSGVVFGSTINLGGATVPANRFTITRIGR